MAEKPNTYIAPSKRKEVAAEAAKDPNTALNPENFPSLGAPIKVGRSNQPSFLQKMLDASIKSDEPQIAAQSTAALIKSGWTILNTDVSTIKGVRESIFERYVERDGASLN